jgi:hypothetical protein
VTNRVDSLHQACILAQRSPAAGRPRKHGAPFGGWLELSRQPWLGGAWEKESPPRVTSND